MATRGYQEVTESDHKEIQKESIKSTLKQILICSSVWVQYFTAGMCVGAPTVFIPQIRKESNSTDIIDDELGSWLYSTSGFAMYPWILILPLLTKRWGRKVVEFITSVCSVTIFIILFFSTNPHHILISEVLQGFLYAGNVTVRVLIVTDYTSPKYRGLFLTIKSANFFWGIWVANAIGTYFHWKNIAILGFICSLYTFSFVFWPESPFWLASKGQFEECKTSYRWIYGYNETSEKNLQELITFYNEKYEDIGLFKMLNSKQFLKPITICVVTVIQYHFSGKIAISLYILDIFKNITEDEDTAYTAMLILDGVTVFGMYLGSLFSRILKRRTLYMSSSFAGVFFLLVISTYLYLVRYSIVLENNYVLVALLMIYSLSISCGPMILGTSIYGEIIPDNFQASCYVITGLSFGLFFSLILKLTPLTFAYFGIQGTFLHYFIACGLCTIYLYIYMPETKNKTKQEIALFFQETIDGEERMPLK